MISSFDHVDQLSAKKIALTANASQGARMKMSIVSYAKDTIHSLNVFQRSTAVLNRVFSCVLAIESVKLAELDADHVLRAFAHQPLFARSFYHAGDQFRRARGMFLVGDHVD